MYARQSFDFASGHESESFGSDVNSAVRVASICASKESATKHHNETMKETKRKKIVLKNVE